MSDELPLTPNYTVDLVIRVVKRNPRDKLYYVYQRARVEGWKTVSKGYPHSTSCYAQLGRIVNRKTRAALQ